MKTVTLTIEVPDDFKKGDNENCRLSIRRYCVWLGNICSADDCPLEIQEEKSCDGCRHLGRPTYDHPCSSCEHYNLYEAGE